MKLRLTLVLFCLLGVGAFSHAQSKKKEPKPTVEDGADAIPVTVRSSKHRKPPPPPPKVRFAPPRIVKDEKPAPPPPPKEPGKAEIQFDKDGKQLPPAPPPPPRVEKVRFTPPKIVKDAPAHNPKEKPVKPDAPPAADFKG